MAAGLRVSHRQEDAVADELDRIGFLVHHPEMFHHYRNVWRHMPAGSVEVVVTGTGPVVDSIVQGCARYELPWRDAAELLRNKQRYTTAVSAFPAVNYSEASTKALARFSLRFMYANGKAGWNFRAWNSMYDGILCFGPYQAQSLASFENVLKIQMGYPRFDRFFNEPIDRAKRLEQLGLDLKRKTVVWLPTWSTLCSIEAFAPAIAALQERHNVIVKPHPLTLSDEPARMQELERFRCVIREPIDNVELFQLADMLVGDYGGSAFGGIYTDRNVVLLDLPGAESNDSTGKDSADVELRNYIPHLGAEQPELLEALLTDRADSIWAEQRKVRAALRELHFAAFYGYASQVAALAIVNAPRAHTKAAQWLSG
jgi:hypothetical protein